MEWLQLIVLFVTAWQSSAWINGGDYTKYFDECTSIYDNGFGNSTLTQRLYEKQCTDLLVPIDSSFKRIGNFSEEQMNLIRGLFRKIYAEAYNTITSRVKRDVGAAHWRVRVEVRQNNGEAFKKFAHAVVNLKKTGVYDQIAAIHEVVVLTAHFGPNILPWHRLYLLVLETALGVPIPQWDSSLDYNMKIPTKSVVWTPKYFGNGVGPVVAGPFAHFQTPAGVLFRKINADGQLISRAAINDFVLSKVHYAEIVSPNANSKSNIEGHHNNVHAWVNGVMGNLAISAYDPVFFCFHAHLDRIWEEFRLRQIKNGIDPAHDFVKSDLIGQQPNERAHLENYINKEGYSRRIASMVIYPLGLDTCPVCYASPEIYCDHLRGVCVSRGAPGTAITVKHLIAADKLGKISGLGSGTFGVPFPIFARDPRTRGDSLQAFAGNKY